MSTRGSTALFYGVVTAAFLAECVAAFTVDVFLSILPALALHLSAVALTGLWFYYIRKHNGNRSGLFLFPMTALAGPFGAGICFLAALIHARYARAALAPSEWIEALFERRQDQESDRLHERITFGMDDFQAASCVEPFRDILSAGTILEKQMAIAKIARHFRPAFAPLLLQAVRAPNAAVRVQAATALAKIEREFMSRCIRLENSLKNLPDNDPAKLELAELYDNYAHAGLLDESSLQSLRSKAIALYEACLKKHKDNPVWSVRLARLYMRQDMPEKARKWLEPAIESGEAPAGAMFWYMEALFRLKKFSVLRQFSEDNAALIEESGGYACVNETGNLLNVWQGPHAA